MLEELPLEQAYTLAEGRANGVQGRPNMKLWKPHRLGTINAVFF